MLSFVRDLVGSSEHSQHQFFVFNDTEQEMELGVRDKKVESFHSQIQVGLELHKQMQGI